MKLIIFTIFLIFASIITIQADKKKSSSKIPDELENNATGSCEHLFNHTAAMVEPVLLVNRTEWPTTTDAINKHCDLGATVYKSMRRYGKCLSGLARQALNVFLHGMKKFIQSTCSNQQKKQDTMEILKCASSESLPGWNKCLNQANRQLDFASDNSTGVEMVGNVCCIYSSMLDCVSANTKSRSDCGKTRDTTTFLRSSISLVMKDVMELICSRYSNQEECNINNPKGVSLLKVVGESNHKVKGAFMLTPLLKTAEKLAAVDEDEVQH